MADLICSSYYGVLCDIRFCWLLCFLCRYLRHKTTVLPFAAAKGNRPLNIQHLQYDMTPAKSCAALPATRGVVVWVSKMAEVDTLQLCHPPACQWCCRAAGQTVCPVRCSRCRLIGLTNWINWYRPHTANSLPESK